jgi:hypothetical protein
MSEQLQTAIKTYNNVSIEAGEPYSKTGLITIEDKSSAEELKNLENAASVQFPEDLRQFYTSFGSLRCESVNENNSIQVFSPRSLLEKLNNPDSWSSTESLGLIDMIKLNWGNDRYEFDEELKSEIKEAVNNNYTCFGWYYTEDNLESAHYLYFDKAGKFGYVFYHQDDFEELVQDFLKPMFKSSPATMSLEELLLESIKVITDLKIRELQ